MLELLRETWSRSQDALRRRAGDAAYDAWLAALRPLALERGVCYLEARSRLVCERVERLYQSLLEDVLSEEVGTRVSVSVVPAPDALVPDGVEVGPTRPVVDASNRTGFLVLSALLEQRAMPSSMFVFYGPPGAGKTFLLRWWAQHSGEPCKWFDGPGLLRVFGACLRDGRVEGLREELVRAPCLVLDELHRVTGHARVQRELRIALEARAQRGAMVLVASRWHPHEIWRCDESLQGVLVSGLVTRIDAPGPQARLTYLRALEGAPSRNGRADSIESLARRVRGGYDDLRRAWFIERQAHALRPHYLRLIDPGQTFRRLCARVCERLAVEREQLLGKTQERRVSFARQVLAHLCVLEGLSRAEIGRSMGGRSRASISYMTKRLAERMATDDKVRARVEELL